MVVRPQTPHLCQESNRNNPAHRQSLYWWAIPVPVYVNWLSYPNHCAQGDWAIPVTVYGMTQLSQPLYMRKLSYSSSCVKTKLSQHSVCEINELSQPLCEMTKLSQQSVCEMNEPSQSLCMWKFTVTSASGRTSYLLCGFTKENQIYSWSMGLALQNITCLLRSSVMREICIFLRPMVVVNRVKPFQEQLYRTRLGNTQSGLTVHQHSICNRTDTFLWVHENKDKKNVFIYTNS